MFALGTILGNAYNGGQCFSYLTKHRWLKHYYLFAGLFVFIGAVVDVQIVWDITDYFIVPVALPNFIAVLFLAFREGHLLKVKN